MCYIASNTKPEKQIVERFEATMLIPELYEPYYFAAGYMYPNLTQKQIEEFIPHAFINEDFKEHTVPNFYSQDVDTNSKRVILPN
ncbi:hypothetical protein [Mesonia aestuariivivens]|uniref:Uncharacterized protein n=1 Tax=Mesonia aestuariivivens TaxID=2796128 RepID=A0ABS6W440_9FLAO|nr:hypothetical protein [Mesonia aestuariivivens]MBW2962297.1 hypothetical protein [Mesonia aestuariivivens]